jgi:hypothetical protein
MTWSITALTGWVLAHHRPAHPENEGASFGDICSHQNGLNGAILDATFGERMPSCTSTAW